MYLRRRDGIFKMQTVGRVTRKKTKLLSLLRTALNGVLISSLVAQPVLAQSLPIVADPSAQGGLRVQTAPNGVPLVDIATPNAAGLSHNTYERFDVGTIGAILNNQAETFGSTQLAGVVQGNPNLAGVPARVILNEIVSTHPSDLRGVIEVAGQAADVVIANPNGITCDGCGFIRTPRVTLTTGVPDVNDGALSDLRVERGEITFGRGGADLSGVDLFEIVSRQVRFDGPVEAQTTRIITGRNRVDYVSGAITLLEGSGETPAYAIDSTAFGGLYAGAISIIATDRGVGVTAPTNMAAHSGEMTLTADGRLVIGQARAQGRVDVRSTSEAVDVLGSLSSGDVLTVRGLSANLSDDAVLAATGALEVTAETITLGAGASIAAGLTETGSLAGSEALSITAQSLTGQDAQLASSGAAALTIGAIDLRRSLPGLAMDLLGPSTIISDQFTAAGAQLKFGDRVTLSSEATLTVQGGTFVGSGDLRFDGADVVVAANVSAAGDLTFAATAGTLEFTGDAWSAGQVYATAAQDMTLAGSVSSGAATALTAGGALSTGATVVSGDDLTVQGASLTNSGTLSSVTDVALVAASGALGSTGVIAGNGTVALTAQTGVSLEGEVSAGGALTGQTGGLLNTSATTLAGTTLTYSADAVSNTGDLSSVGALSLMATTGDLSSTGPLTTNDALAVTAAQGMTLAGSVSSGAATALTAGGALSTSATVVSGDDLTVQGASLTNSGTLSSVTDVALVAASGALGSTGVIAGNGGVALTAQTGVSLEGEVSAGGALTGQTGGLLNTSATTLAGATLTYSADAVSNTGDLSSVGALSLRTTTGDLSSTGTLTTNDALAVTAAEDMTLSGSVSSGAATELVAGGALSTGATVVSGDDLTVQGASLTNSGTLSSVTDVALVAASGALGSTGVIAGNGTVALTAQTGVNLEGEVSAGGALTGQTGGLLNTSATTLAGTTLTYSADAVSNTGDLSSVGALSLMATTGDLSSTGPLTTNDALAVTAAQGMTLAGSVSSGAATALTAGGALSTSATVVSGDDLTVQGASLTNSGTLSSVTDVALVAASGALGSTGVIAGNGTVALTAQTGVNLEGEVSAGEALTGQTGGLLNTSATTLAGTTLTYSADAVSNTGDLSSVGALSLTAATGDLSSTGSLTTNDALAVTAAEDMTLSGSVSSGAATALTAGGALSTGATVVSGDDLTVQGASLTNSGTLSSVTDVALVAASGALGSTGVIAGNGTVALTAQTGVNLEGEVSAGEALTGQTGGLLNTSATTLAGTTLTYSADAVSNTGDLSSVGALSLTAATGDLSSTGSLTTNDALAVTAAQDMTLAGSVSSGATTELVAGGALSTGATVVSGDDLTVQGASLTNSGTLSSVTDVALVAASGALGSTGVIAGNGAVALTAQTGVSLEGEVSAGGALTGQTGGLLNTSATTLAGATLTYSADAVSNTGDLSSVGALSLRTTTGDLSSTGTLTTNDALAVTAAQDMTLAGSVSSGATTELVAGGALSTGATVVSGDDLTVQGASLTNSGTLSSVTDVALVAASGALGSTGVIAGNGAVALTAQTGVSLEGEVSAGGALTGQTGGLLNTSATTLAGTTLTYSADAVSNTGDLSSVGALSLRTTTGDLSSTGSLTTNDALAVTAAQDMTLAGSVSSGATTVLTAGDGLVTAADLVAGGPLSLDGKTVVLSRDIQTHGDVAIRASVGGLVLDHALEAAGDIYLSAIGDISNNTDIKSEGSIQLQSQTEIRNTRTIVATSGLSASSVDVINEASGAMGATDGDVILQASGDIDNAGLLYAGQDLTAQLDGTLTNDTADILAEGNVTIAGLTSAAAVSVENKSANIEAISGSLSITAQTVTNEQAVPSVISKTTVSTAEGPASDFPDISHPDNTYNVVQTTTTTRDVASSSDVPARMLAGADISITAGSVLNQYSQIAANGDLTIIGGSVQNTGRDLQEEVVTQTVSQYTERYCKFRIFVCLDWGTRYLERTQESTSTGTYGALYATLQAGGTLTASVTSYVSNEAVRAGATQIGLTSGDRQVLAPDVQALTVPSVQSGEGVAAGQAFDGMSVASISAGQALDGVTTTYVSASQTFDGAPASSVSTGQSVTDNAQAVATGDMLVSGGGDQVSGPAVNTDAQPSETTAAARDASLSIIDTASFQNRRGLFVTSVDPATPFLVETRHEFIDRDAFLSSDYFMDQIGGYDPELTQRRFGDAYVEARLVQSQYASLTGRSLSSSPEALRSVMQGYYDQGIAEGARLQLTPGVALSAEQVASLESSILWLEERVVDGQTVLLPVLYLGRTELASVDLASARIVADRVDVTAGSLLNSGSITGSDGIRVVTSGDVINRGGQVLSAGDVTIRAGQRVANISGQIVGRDVVIAATDVENSTAVIRDQTVNGFADRLQAPATVRASNSLTVGTGDSIVAQGGSFDAGGNITLTAGQQVALGAATVETSREDSFAEGYDRGYSLENELSEVNAGGSVAIRSGDGVALTGVEVRAGAEIDLQAGGDLTISSVQDVSQEDYRFDKDTGGLFGVETNVRTQDQNVATRETVIAAGEGLAVTSEAGDITVVASDLSSGSETVLSAEAGGVALLTNEDSTFTRSERREEDLLWWESSDVGSSETIRTPTRITAEGGLQIVVGDQIIAEYVPTGGDFEAGIAQLASTPGLAWMADLEARDGVAWREAQTAFETWNYHDQGLTEAGALLVTAIMTYATGGVGGVTDTLSSQLASGLGVSAQNVAMNAALKAGVGNLINQASVSLVNNQGDLGATLQDLGSNSSLRALVTSMVSAGLGQVALERAGLPELPDHASLAERTWTGLQRDLITASVSTSVEVAINGGDLGDALTAGWTNAMVMAGLGAVQERIGDFAQANGLPEGDVQKIVAHAVAGGLASELSGQDFADGALAAAMAEILSGPIGDSELSSSRQIELQKLIATTAVILASDGDAQSAAIAGNIGASAHENNYLKHSELVAFLSDLDECTIANIDCSEKIEQYRSISEQHDAELKACGTNASCITEHLSQIAASDTTDILLSVLTHSALTRSGYQGTFETLQYLTAESVENFVDMEQVWEQAGATYREEFVIANCGGQRTAACQASYEESLIGIAADSKRRAENAKAFESFLNGVGIVLDVATPAGTPIAAVDCINALSVSACGGIVLELIGPVGDLGQIIVRRGSDIFAVTTDRNTYRILDDSIGAARPDLPDGHKWATDAAGNSGVLKPDGSFTSDADGIQKIVATKGGTGARFADQAKLDDHFNRHGADFGATSSAQYQQMADNFLTGPRGTNTLELVRPNGDVVRYDPTTDAFGVVSSNGTVRTYYVPDPAVHGYPTNLDYFNAQ